MSSKKDRLKQELDFKRRLFLDAAIKVYIKKNIQSATIEDIVTEAGYSVGSFYNYFKTKEDIYYAVLANISEQFYNKFVEAVKGIDDPIVQLKKILYAKFEFVSQNINFFKLYISDHPIFEWKLQKKAGKKALKYYYDSMKFQMDIIKKCQEKKFLIDVDPEFVASIFFSIFEGFISYWIQLGKQMPLNKYFDKVWNAFILGFGSE